MERGINNCFVDEFLFQSSQRSNSSNLASSGSLFTPSQVSSSSSQYSDDLDADDDFEADGLDGLEDGLVLVPVKKLLPLLSKCQNEQCVDRVLPCNMKFFKKGTFTV